MMMPNGGGAMGGTGRGGFGVQGHFNPAFIQGVQPGGGGVGSAGIGGAGGGQFGPDGPRKRYRVDESG